MKKILIYLLFLTNLATAQAVYSLYEVPEFTSTFYIQDGENNLDYSKIVFDPNSTKGLYLKSIGFKKYNLIDENKKQVGTIEFTADNQSGTMKINNSKLVSFQKLMPERFNAYINEEKLKMMLVGQIFDYKMNGIKSKWQVYQNEIKELNILNYTPMIDNTGKFKVFIYSADARNKARYLNIVLNITVSAGTELLIQNIHCESFSRK